MNKRTIAGGILAVIIGAATALSVLNIGDTLGPNLLVNPGFDVRTAWNATQTTQPVPYVLYAPYAESPNILVPQPWGFEYQTGSNFRNPSDFYCGTLRVPEAGNAMRDNLDWRYRVDGYNKDTNPEAFRWFKGWACTHAGPTQTLSLLEEQTYEFTVRVSTWSTPDAGRTGNRSQLDTADDRSNIEWLLRWNFSSSGSIFGGSSSRPFGYSDGIYDFNDAVFPIQYNGTLSARFTVPANSDANNTQQVKVGMTASARYAFSTMDFHVDNASLRCVNCPADGTNTATSAATSTKTNTPAATKTPTVTLTRTPTPTAGVCGTPVACVPQVTVIVVTATQGPVTPTQIVEVTQIGGTLDVFCRKEEADYRILTNLNVRGGPGLQYPPITSLPAGIIISIQSLYEKSPTEIWASRQACTDPLATWSAVRIGTTVFMSKLP